MRTNKTESTGRARITRRRNYDPKFKKVKPNLWLYVLIMILLFAVYAALIGLGLANADVMLMDTGPLRFNLGFLFVLPVIAHILVSYFKDKEVRTDELAGLYFFGIPLKRVGPGKPFVAFGLFKLDRVPSDMQTIFVPAERDFIFWGDEKEDLPEGMVRPIWLPTRAPTGDEKQPLDAQMQIGVVYVDMYTVEDIFTFRAKVRSIEEANKQLETMSTSVLRRDIAKRTVSGALGDQDELDEMLDDHVRDRTSDWGVNMRIVEITDINVSHELARSMRDRAKARLDAETRVIAAQAEGQEREILGLADGKAGKARAKGPLDGQAEGMANMMTRLKVTGEAVLASETAREAFAKASGVIVGAGSGIGDLLGTVKAAQLVLGTKEKEKT